MSAWYWRNGTLAVDPRWEVGGQKWKDAMKAMEEKLRDYEYKKVRLTRLWWGGHVSTVWLGLDHAFNFTEELSTFPMIFETMVFPGNQQDRYTTEQEAIKGHWHMYLLASSPTWAVNGIWDGIRTGFGHRMPSGLPAHLTFDWSRMYARFDMWEKLGWKIGGVWLWLKKHLK